MQRRATSARGMTPLSPPALLGDSHAADRQPHDDARRMGAARHPRALVGRLVFLHRHRHQGSAGVHHRCLPRGGGRCPALRRRAPDRPCHAARRRLMARLFRHGLPEQCRALQPDRLGAEPCRQRPGRHPQRHHAALRRGPRPLPHRRRAHDGRPRRRPHHRLRRRGGDDRAGCARRHEHRPPRRTGAAAGLGLLCDLADLRPPLRPRRARADRLRHRPVRRRLGDDGAAGLRHRPAVDAAHARPRRVGGADRARSPLLGGRLHHLLPAPEDGRRRQSVAGHLPGAGERHPARRRLPARATGARRFCRHGADRRSGWPGSTAARSSCSPAPEAIPWKSGNHFSVRNCAKD